MSISLIKERESKVAVCLKKKTNRLIFAKVNLILDVSTSMYGVYQSNRVQEIVEKVFPIALRFSQSKELGMWIFSNNWKRLKPIKMDNYEGYVRKNIFELGYVEGGTEYSGVMDAVLNNRGMGFINWIKSLFKKKTDEVKLPTYNIFITDGDASDKSASAKIILEASNKPHFWQFVGTWGSGFRFLQDLDDMTGRVVDNADFFSIPDIHSLSDEDLYDKLLNEFPTWIENAMKEGIL